MDVDLPVWTIRPNWKGGVLERLEWLTEVLASDTGVEQRRAKRLSPRRSFEFTVNPTRNDRTYLDLALHRLGSEDWLVPLWHDQAKLSAIGQIGQTAILFDNTHREFLDDGLALLFFDTFTWEVVGIDTQTDDGALLSEALIADWPRGTKLYPLRRMSLSTDSQIAALTSRVGQAQLLWTVNEANDFDDTLPDDFPTYLDSPLITREPDRSREINVTHTRLAEEIDGGLGLRQREDSADRSFSVQAHNWMVQGREAQHAFRRLLYHLRGRQRMAWLPSFNDDVMISRVIDEGDTSLYVEKIGLHYIGGGSPVPGRTRIWTGKEVLLNANVGAPNPSEERLGLVTPTTFAYAPGASGSFLDAVRLDTDLIELHHHTDTDGVFECGATFRAFANDRETPEPIYTPIAIAEKSDVLCGAPPEDNPCFVPPVESCPLKSGYEFILAFNGCNVNYCPTRNFYPPEFFNAPGHPNVVNPPIEPGGPGGKKLVPDQQVNNCNNSGAVYEHNWYNEPGNEWYQHPLAIKLQGQKLMEWETTNGGFKYTVYGAILPADGGSLTIQYDAFWCGGNVAKGQLNYFLCAGPPPGCPCNSTAVLSDLGMVGNVPYTFTW